MSEGQNRSAGTDDGVPRSQEQAPFSVQVTDARAVLAYLVAPESDQYVAIMEELEASITDLTPGEVRRRLESRGVHVDGAVLESRLDQLRTWGAASARSDHSRILRHADLLARNWRYTATVAGRQVQRFYKKVLAGKPVVREIPLTSLARVLEAAQKLASLNEGGQSPEGMASVIGRLFVDHDDLDAALVGAEDSISSLMDRFDLDDASTAELKSLLVSYATHVAAELERGSSRVYRALSDLQPRFAELASSAVRASDARVLIERGALAASRGGRVEDWEDLLRWFDAGAGRAARFALRLVRALPGMHANLRRLHTSSGMATSRSRAIALARACADPIHGAVVFLAATGDHPWRKLHGESDDTASGRIPSWRDGPGVEVPELLWRTGRAGARGGAPPARDDTKAREAVEAGRRQRAAEHSAAIREVLAAASGTVLSDHAARAALVVLTAAAQAGKVEGKRTAVRAGLGCTLFDAPGAVGVLHATTWRVLTPGRIVVFHREDAKASLPEALFVAEGVALA